MIFDGREKELLLKLITYEQSRLAVSVGDSDDEYNNVNNNDSVIQIYETIKKKIRKLWL